MAKKDFTAVAQITADAANAPEFKFNFIFQVINPFLKYQKGALIVSDDAIQAVIDNGDALNCNRLSRK